MSWSKSGRRRSGSPTRPSASWPTTRASRPSPELPTNVYRVDGRTGKATIVADDINAPNGLCFSPDGIRLYIVDSRAAPQPLIRVYDVAGDGPGSPTAAASIDGGAGTPTASAATPMAISGAGWGRARGLRRRHRASPEGKPIGRIALPERCANLCFGGARRNRLFMAASQSLYALYVNTQGVSYF